MTKASKKYRKLMAELDEKGVITSIDRVSREKFTFLQNGTAVKTYRTRNSCNRYLVRLHKKTIQTVQ